MQGKCIAHKNNTQSFQEPLKEDRKRVRQERIRTRHRQHKPAGRSCLAEKTPTNMQSNENKTGTRNAGATRLIILTPPKTTKQRRIDTTIP